LPRTAIEICPHADGPESQELFCVRYGCFFNCLPDPTSIKSTRPARPNWAVKLTLLTIRGRAHQRDTAALRGPGHFPAWQRQRAVISPGETTADGTRNACAWGALHGSKFLRVTHVRGTGADWCRSNLMRNACANFAVLQHKSPIGLSDRHRMHRLFTFRRLALRASRCYCRPQFFFDS
jgi:hypothetical protein